MLNTTDLVEYSTASALAETFARESRRVTDALTELDDALANLGKSFKSDRLDQFSLVYLTLSGRRYPINEDGIEKFRKKIRQIAWCYLIDKLGVETIMPSGQAEQLREALRNDDKLDEFPEIHPETIVSVINGYFESAGDLLSDLIREEYDWLRPRRAGKYKGSYKTNSPYQVNRKVILPNVVEWYWDQWRVQYGSARAHLRSLNNVFRMLDGQGPSDHHYGELYVAIEEASGDRFETEYFEGRCFQNGNVHLTFRRLDLLEKFNRVGGGQNLGSDAR